MGLALKVLAFLAGVFLFLSFGIYLLEYRDAGLTIWDTFWYTMVTVTTVGYGDIYPSSFMGRFFAILMFLYSVTIFSFLISKIQDLVADRQRQKELGMNGTKFTNHVVICSWTLIAQVALKELLAAGRKCAVISPSADFIPVIRTLGDERVLFVTVGDITDEQTLDRVNVREASTVIAASDEDTENLILALNIRHINPQARIVVAIKRAELRNTLTASGVTYVASPFEMSGRLVASAAFEPEVAKFIEDISSGADDEDEMGFDLQQFLVPANSSLANNTAAQAAASLKQIEGPLLVAVAKIMQNGRYQVFPHPDDSLVVAPNDSLIVLGNGPQNGRVAQMLGVIQGR